MYTNVMILQPGKISTQLNSTQLSLFICSRCEAGLNKQRNRIRVLEQQGSRPKRYIIHTHTLTYNTYDLYTNLRTQLFGTISPSRLSAAGDNK